MTAEMEWIIIKKVIADYVGCHVFWCHLICVDSMKAIIKTLMIVITLPISHTQPQGANLPTTLKYIN